jgi:hypothetical protein
MAQCFYEPASLQGHAEIKRAAKRDHPESVFNLGNIYKEGNGLECNVKKALRYFTRAAEQGHAPAQYILGLCTTLVSRRSTRL